MRSLSIYDAGTMSLVGSRLPWIQSFPQCMHYWRVNDKDLLGTIVYRVLGDVPATSYFDVDSLTGAVSVKANLLQDRTLSYTVSSYYGLRFHIFKDEICNSVFLLLY